MARKAHVILRFLDQEGMPISQVLAAFVLVPGDKGTEVLVAEAAGFVGVLDLHVETSFSVFAKNTRKKVVDQADL
jgi:hypothetical protein